ncbi:MAG: N-acetylmuramoyl-L-alanine amidase, partial [Bacteroidaceae bacterium]|nr:N-acetylmuramoyl-L-alanine amidase [Bacteroidaceae bacterium]
SATTVADKPTSTATGTFDNSGIVYRVQILTSNVELGASDPQLKGHKNVFYYKENGLYKYTIGETKNRKEAFDIRKQLLNDFPDAFVITFNNGKRQK